MFSFINNVLFLPPLLLVLFVAPAGIASMLWAPIGALICALLAWRKGLGARRCALAGAAYSALFFLPWVYLTARMFGKTIPKPPIILAYIALYLAWLLGPTQFCYDIWIDGHGGTDTEYYPAAWFWAWLLNMLAMAAAPFLMPSTKRINPFRPDHRDNGPLRDTLPNPVYLLPFALFGISILVVFALMALVDRFGG